MIKMCQNRFRPGLRPGPRWGSSRRSPRPPSRLGRGIPSPHSPPRSTPSASRTRHAQAPSTQNPGYASAVGGGDTGSRVCRGMNDRTGMIAYRVKSREIKSTLQLWRQVAAPQSNSDVKPWSLGQVPSDHAPRVSARCVSVLSISVIAFQRNDFEVTVSIEEHWKEPLPSAPNWES